MAKLSGKVALLTGGSSGIGLATAQRFVAEAESELPAAAALIGSGVIAFQGMRANSAIWTGSSR